MICMQVFSGTILSVTITILRYPRDSWTMCEYSMLQTTSNVITIGHQGHCRIVTRPKGNGNFAKSFSSINPFTSLFPNLDLGMVA